MNDRTIQEARDEGFDIYPCDTCQYSSLDWREEPCESCTGEEALDCISRQAALDAIGEQPLVWTDDDDFARGEATQWEYDTEAIKALPSAQPRIRGRWQEITEGDCSGYDPVLAGYDDPVVGYVCSVCHEGYEKEVIGEVTWNFCPNCGADMRERGEDAPN